MADMSGKATDQCEDSGDQVKLKKLCMDCGTSKTPLWRGGPAGPKSLCNACGIRNRKKRSSLLELTKVDERKMKKIIINNNGSSCSSNGNLDSSSKDRLMAMWDILRPQINMRIEELNEEQQAAILLMSLSHKFSYC